MVLHTTATGWGNPDETYGEKERNRRDGVRATGFYSSKRWQEVRDDIKLRDKMTCQHCGIPILGRYIVDHIEPLTLENYHDWDIAYNPDNLQLLCQACHNVKTFTKTTKINNRW